MSIIVVKRHKYMYTIALKLKYKYCIELHGTITVCKVNYKDSISNFYIYTRSTTNQSKLHSFKTMSYCCCRSCCLLHYLFKINLKLKL